MGAISTIQLCRAADQAITGNLFVTGTVDIDGDSLFFGTQGMSPGLSLKYADAENDTATFFLNRNPASWLWAHSASIVAMRLTRNHELVLYNPDGQTAAISLSPTAAAGGPAIAIGGTLFRGASGVATMFGGFTPQKLALTGAADSNVNINNTAFLSAQGQPGNRMTVIGTNMYWNGVAYTHPSRYETGYSIEIHSGINAFRLMRFSSSFNEDLIEGQIGVNGADTHFNTSGGNVGIGTDRPRHKLSVRGGMGVEGQILVIPKGDLDMGSFTSGPPPTL